MRKTIFTNGRSLFIAGLALLLSISLWALSSNTAFAYNISGTVSYNGTKTGRVYLNVDVNVCCSFGFTGTSIASPGSFTIRGVQPGAYTLNAFLDHVGRGMRNISNPAGSSVTVVVSSSDVTNVNITLTDPLPVAPFPPANVNVTPGNQSALVMWDTISGPNGIAAAEHYNIYWDATPAVSKTVHSGAGSAMAAREGFYFADGLSDGTSLYFVVTAVSDGVESAESGVFGPVTIGSVSGGYTITGTISFPDTATGPMYVGLNQYNAPGLTFAKIDSPTSPQTYSVSGLSAGTWLQGAIIDMNNNGEIDAGDMMQAYTPDFILTVSGDMTKDFALTTPNVNSVLGTQHFRNPPYSDTYGFIFAFSSAGKQPVNVVLTSGFPGLPGPVDIGRSWDPTEEFFVWYGLSTGRPAVGDTYNFDVTYSDGTTETIPLSVTGVLDNFPVPTYPIGQITDTTPTFTWTAPPSVSSVHEYTLHLADSSGGEIWFPSDIPGTQTSILYNDDGTAAQPSLKIGETYSWTIDYRDWSGNYTTILSSFTPVAVCSGLVATIFGTPGNDTITGTAGPDVIHGLAGNDTINGLGGNDIICGGPGNDKLSGGDGSDKLFGQDGNDILKGGAGNDRLTGGTGNDTADYAAAASAVTVNLSTGSATGEGTDVLNTVENITGSPYNDILTGNIAANVLKGLGGNDTLNSLGGNDKLYGGAGDDTLDGGVDTDTCDGGSHVSGDSAANCETLIGIP